MSGGKTTVCINGHVRTPENTRTTRHGRAICLECRPQMAEASPRWGHEQYRRDGAAGMLTRCPCCDELVRLLPLLRGGGWRMCELGSTRPHAEVCQPLVDQLERQRRRVAKLTAQRRVANAARTAMRAGVSA